MMSRLALRLALALALAMDKASADIKRDHDHETPPLPPPHAIRGGQSLGDGPCDHVQPDGQGKVPGTAQYKKLHCAGVVLPILSSGPSIDPESFSLSMPFCCDQAVRDWCPRACCQADLRACPVSTTESADSDPGNLLRPDIDSRLQPLGSGDYQFEDIRPTSPPASPPPSHRLSLASASALGQYCNSTSTPCSCNGHVVQEISVNHASISCRCRPHCDRCPYNRVAWYPGERAECESCVGGFVLASGNCIRESSATNGTIAPRLGTMTTTGRPTDRHRPNSISTTAAPAMPAETGRATGADDREKPILGFRAIFIVAGVVAAVIVLGLAAGVGYKRDRRPCGGSSSAAPYANTAVNVVNNAMYDAPTYTDDDDGDGDGDAQSKRPRMSDPALSGGVRPMGSNIEMMGMAGAQWQMQPLDQRRQLEVSHEGYGQFQKGQDRLLQAHASGPGSVHVPAMPATDAYDGNAGFGYPAAVAMAPKREGFASTNPDHLAGLGTSSVSGRREPLSGSHGQPFAAGGAVMLPGMQMHALQPTQQPTLLFSNGQTGATYHPSMSQMHSSSVYDPSTFRPGPRQGVPMGMHGMTMSGSPVPRAGQPLSAMPGGPPVHDPCLVPAYGNVQNAAVMAYDSSSNGMAYYVPNGAHAHQPVPMGGQPSVQAPSWMVPQMAAQMTANLPPAIYYNGHPMHPGGQMLGSMQLAPHGQDPSAAAAAINTATTLHGDGGKRNPTPLPKLGRLHQVPLEDWTVGITKACRTVFSRLEITGDPKVRDEVLRRLLAGVEADTCRHTEASPTRCFLVKRGNHPGRGPRKKSPFQIPVAGSRILAQKALYAAYNKLSAQQMGTWQVNQKCKRNDTDWWCFEPSHLEKCERDHLAKCIEKHPIPRGEDAIYVSRVRAQAQPPKKEAHVTHDSSQPKPPPEPEPVPGREGGTAGPDGPMGANDSSTVAAVTTISQTARGIDPRPNRAHNNGDTGLANGQPQVSGLPPHHFYAMATGAPDDSSGSAVVVPTAPDDSSSQPHAGSPYDEESSSASIGSSVDSNESDLIDGPLTGVTSVPDFMPMPLDMGFAFAGDSTLLQN